MKILVVSLCTSGVMREHFITYARYFSQKNELYCVTNDNVSNDELSAVETLNVRYKRSAPWTYFSLVKLSKIKKFISRISPDVVFVFTPHPVNILLSRFLKKFKVIYQVHDPLPHSGTGFLDSKVLLAQHKRYYKNSKVLLVAGDAIKKQLLDSAPYVDKNKVISVPFGLVDNMVGDRENVAVDENIDVLFFGRVEYYKGLDNLIKAMKIVGDKYKCVIAGKGNLREIYGDDLEIPSNVTATGKFVPDDELISLIKRCKIIVLPYRDATGSMTVVQAFYYGKPVIATDVGVFPEYVGNGGIIVGHENPSELADAIKTLLGNEELRKAYAKNALDSYEERFSMRKISERLQTIFEWVANCNN